MGNEHNRNGSAGVFGSGAHQRDEATQRLATLEKAGKRYRRLRAYLDTLCEVERAATGVIGLDRGSALRAYADAIQDSLAIWVSSAALARAEALDLERGTLAGTAPAPSAEETSEVRRQRRERGEDSQPGKKRT